MLSNDLERLSTLVRVQVPNGNSKSVAVTKDFLKRNIVRTAQGDEVSGSPGELWNRAQPRSRLRWLHGLVFMGDWIRAWPSLINDERHQLEESAIELVNSWSRMFTAWPSDHPMAYHDETTALRLRSLMAVHLSPMGNSLKNAVAELILETVSVLTRSDFHAGLNNHGMFQDGALLTYGGMLILDGKSAGRESEDAWKRIVKYAQASFGPDGVHLEHSPSYHLLVSRKIQQYSELARVMELADSESATHVLNLAARFAAHATTPRSRYVPLGDTSPETVSSSMVSTFNSPEFAWAVTQKEGKPSAERAAVFEHSGYASFRTSWTDRDAVYVMVANAYNGSYHKHSDELNVYLESEGLAILDDPGPYGYDYSDPLVAYAYSSKAHNTLLVDGRGLPRHDGSMDKTWLEDRGTTPTELSVVAKTDRYPGVFASRAIQASGSERESAQVHIRDEVISQETHKYTYLWHFSPRLTPLLRGNFVELYFKNEKRAELFISSKNALHMRLLRGKVADEVLGLHFPRMGETEESTVLQIDAYSDKLEISTEIRFANYRLVDRGISPSSRWRVSNGNVALRYLVEAPKSPASLSVVFSSIRQPGDFTYDDRTALNGTDSARLFILDDFGSQGAYYYSNAREKDIFQSVQGLIADTLERFGLSRNQLTTIGSSKGGSAALIHGYAARAGRILAGAPQALIGHFTANHHPEVLEYMAGGTGEGDKAWADEIVYSALRDSSTETRVSILVGGDDHHLRGHVIPFSVRANQLGRPISVSTIPNLTHSGIGGVFKDFVRTSEGTGENGYTIPYIIRYEDSTSDLYVALGDLLRDRVAACYLYQDGVVVNKTPYSDTALRKWQITKGHNYFVRIFLRAGNVQLSTFNTEVLEIAK